jgi:hypothetical protein
MAGEVSIPNVSAAPRRSCIARVSAPVPHPRSTIRIAGRGDSAGFYHVLSPSPAAFPHGARLVTFEDGAVAYDQKDAAGFIKLNALRLRTYAVRKARGAKK